ncbi:unnamed protein product [Cuscuta epithymum]|uniref:Uncharacterized protein n=1 Tax=Cuscuta epithymum TaxID=186058 RepID=A0AAV0FK82_9ASTE|nr:unnamed protein product [Cuscuta epithymum]
MATSAFKSTTKRAPIGGSAEVSSSSSSSGNRAARRSRSLSRFSRRLPFGEEPAEAAASSGFEPTPRRRFVNTARGSVFPEISLDDLAQEFFCRKDEEIDSSDPDRTRSARRGSDIGRWASETASSQRRGRSVSRQSSSSKTSGDRKSVVSDRSRVNTGLSESNSRRRRSVSSVRFQISDSESHSSVLTDDDLKDHPGKNVNEKIIRAVYSQKQAEHPTEDDINSGLYEAMKKGLRYAVEEIKVELEQGMVRKSGNHSQLDSAARNSYVAKLEESEMRKQDLLAEILLEDQKGRELSRIVTENSAPLVKPSRTRKKSNDPGTLSRQLTDEAEKYFEDFITNVEDTDISSFDGERSDGSSTLGGMMKAWDGITDMEPRAYQIQEGSNIHRGEMDGVNLPWLRWETSNDGSSSGKAELRTPLSRKLVIWDAKQDHSCYSPSSQGSYSPAIMKYHEISKLSKRVDSEENYKREVPPKFDMHEYVMLQQSEEMLFERYRERKRISSGGLLLTCTNAFSNLIL